MKWLILIGTALLLYFGIALMPPSEKRFSLPKGQVKPPSSEAKACAKDGKSVIWVKFETVTDASSHAVLLRLDDLSEASDDIARQINISVYDQSGQTIGKKNVQIYPSVRFIPTSLPLHWYLKEPHFLRIEFTPEATTDCVYLKSQS